MCRKKIEPQIKAYLFDWGDTLMVDFPGVPGKMCDWDIIQSVSGAGETLEYLSRYASIYIASGALESVADDIEAAFKRVGLDQYIKGYFCKANTGIEKGTPLFLEAILSELNISKDHVAIVGNSLNQDILPAANIGMRSFWLSSSTTSQIPATCIRINTLLDVCKHHKKPKKKAL